MKRSFYFSSVVERESSALRFWFVLLYLSSELPNGVADYGHIYRDESSCIEECCDKGDEREIRWNRKLIGLGLSVKSDFKQPGKEQANDEHGSE